jgi:hypothetical protein
MKRGAEGAAASGSGAPPLRISVKSRTFKRGAVFVDYQESRHCAAVQISRLLNIGGIACGVWRKRAF